jgi:hypothetical protein
MKTSTYYGIESDADVPPEDDSEAVEDSHNDGADVNHDIPPPPVDLFCNNS